MAKKAMIERNNRKQKYEVRHRNRCMRCGRPRAYIRKFGLCRVCFREKSLRGEIPGVRKSSW
jgi:small subunit ribosomal protein S14